MKELTIGCDPEVFLVENNRFISAHDRLPGTKEKPFPVPKGALQVDGVAGEFNIDPAGDEITFSNNIQVVLDTLKKTAGTNISIEPVAIFDKGYWNKLPEDPKMLGCNPDFNAWTGQPNPMPHSDEYPTMRTAAGHIHLGWTKDADPYDGTHFQDCCTLVKQLDYYLGISSLLWDKDNRRRSLYGRAGAFRPKPYGLEYRVLSNVWIKSDAMRRWVFTTARRAFNDLAKNGICLEDKYENLAQKIIDENINWYGNAAWFKQEGLPSSMSNFCPNHLKINNPPIDSLQEAA